MSNSIATEFEAIFFDMDGTLINSEPQWMLAETELMAEYGHAWTIEDQRYCLGGPLTKVGIYMSKLAGSVESPEFFHEELVRRTIRAFEQEIEYMPGAFELLMESIEAGIAVGLVTASPAPMMRATLSRFPEGLFNVTISGDDVALTNPSPECYILAAKTLGVNIENCIILEDSITGVAAASASGAFVIAIPHLVSIEESPRLKVLQTLDGITVERLKRIYRSIDRAELV